MFGEEREYLTIKILHNDMTVMVPCENAAIAGLRRVIDEETVKKVLAVLQDEISDMVQQENEENEKLGVSASGGVNFAVWHPEASASLDSSQTNRNAAE